MPVLLGETGEVEWNELLKVAKHMDIAEGPQMVEHPLFLRIEELQVLGAHPRVGDNVFAHVKAPIAKNLVDGPGDFL